MAYHPKALCDVTKVEIAVGVRLTTNSVEGFTFQVPRTRVNYFQDDLYPATLCVEKAALTAKEWFQGDNALQKTMSLKPPNMKCCKFKGWSFHLHYYVVVSDAPKEAPAAKKFTSFNPDYKSDQQKKEEVMML